MNSKGIEFAVGFIVMLILTIVVFIISISFLFQWFSQAEELQGEIDKRTSDQILSILKGGQQVAIPFALQSTRRGDIVTYGVGVKNTGEQRDFTVVTSFSGGYLPDGQELPTDKQHIETAWLGSFSTLGPYTLKRGEQKVIPLSVKPSSITETTQAKQGDYIFNVCVFSGTPTECSIENFKSNPDGFYTKKMYQVTTRLT